MCMDIVWRTLSMGGGWLKRMQIPSIKTSYSPKSSNNSSTTKIRITSLGAFWSIIIMLKIHLDATAKVEKCVNKSSFGRVKIYASDDGAENIFPQILFSNHFSLSFPSSPFPSSFPHTHFPFSRMREEKIMCTGKFPFISASTVELSERLCRFFSLSTEHEATWLMLIEEDFYN
jgi:hypothetical protein